MGIIYLPINSAFGQNMRPSDGAKLYFYEAGSAMGTPVTVYADSAETTPLSNPVVANASGRFPVIYCSVDLQIVLKDKNDVQIWEEDNVSPYAESLYYRGDFDSSTNSGDYPATGSIGDLYRVTEKFVLNAASGSHQLYVYDFIVANKNGATGIDVDWNIIKGKDFLLDEDDFATDSDTLAPSQQSAGKYIRDGTYTFTNKTIDSADNTITLDTSDAGLDLTINSADADLTIDSGDTDTDITLDTGDSGLNLTIDSADAGLSIDLDTSDASTTINSANTIYPGVVEKSTQVENEAGTASTKYPSVEGVRQLLRAVGGPPVYVARSWITFDGTGTISIVDGGNVSSLVDNGVGNYTVNFTIAIGSTTYCVVGGADDVTAGGVTANFRNKASASVDVKVYNSNAVLIDTARVYCIIMYSP